MLAGLEWEFFTEGSASNTEFCVRIRIQIEIRTGRLCDSDFLYFFLLGSQLGCLLSWSAEVFFTLFSLRAMFNVGAIQYFFYLL
jgi:hypothetical protein